MKTNKDTITLKLSLQVEYSLNGEDATQVENNLYNVAQRAIDEGLLTGYGNEEVEDYLIDVSEVQTGEQDVQAQHDGKNASKTLTVFAQTREGGAYRMDVDQSWLDKVKALAALSLEHKIDVEMPYDIEYKDQENTISNPRIAIKPSSRQDMDVSFIEISGLNELTNKLIFSDRIYISALQQSLDKGQEAYVSGVKLFDDRAPFAVAALYRNALPIVTEDEPTPSASRPKP